MTAHPTHNVSSARALRAAHTTARPPTRARRSAQRLLFSIVFVRRRADRGVCMLSIATKVERIVMESSFLTEGLRRNLINLSELARQLQPQLESDMWKPVGQAAVVMALRRVAERLPEASNQPLALAQKTGELTTRTELTEYTYRYSDSINECHRQLLSKAEPMRGAFVTVTRGVNEVMVICSRVLTAMVEEVFAGERLLARQDN